MFVPTYDSGIQQFGNLVAATSTENCITMNDVSTNLTNPTLRETYFDSPGLDTFHGKDWVEKMIKSIIANLDKEFDGDDSSDTSSIEMMMIFVVISPMTCN